jgi:hypothetical protein
VLYILTVRYLGIASAGRGLVAVEVAAEVAAGGANVLRSEWAARQCKVVR